MDSPESNNLQRDRIGRIDLQRDLTAALISGATVTISGATVTATSISSAAAVMTASSSSPIVTAAQTPAQP